MSFSRVRQVFSALIFLCYLGSPLLAQESAEQPHGAVDPSAVYLEQTQPALADWIRTSAPDVVSRELQIEVASTLIRLFEADQLAPFLSYFGGISADDLVPLLTEPGGPLTRLTSDVSIGAVKGLMVDVGSELAAEVIFQAPVLRDTPDAFKGPLEIALGAALKETLSIFTHDGSLETLVLTKVLERAQDAIEIYQATGALAKAESGALIATALMVSSAAEIGVEIGGERGQRLIDLARRDIAPVMPAAVGSDDAETVIAIYSAALDALVAYHRGDEETASSAYQAVLEAAGDSNLGPLRLLRNPLDWGVAAMNLGKDSPEIALEVLLATTELAAVGRGEIANFEPRNLMGDWVGHYYCSQGLTGLTVSFDRLASDGSIDGRFHFYPIEGSGPRAKTGTFELSLRLNEGDNTVVATAGDWIDRPRGWRTVGFTATLSANALSGHIDLSTCGAVELQRVQ